MREKSFYEATKRGVQESFRRLLVMKVPASRPNDFLAEMVKSDDQMLKIRLKITDESKRISAVEERKRQQANKKFNKQVHVKRKEERAKEKKETLKDIAKWRTDRKSDQEKVKKKQKSNQKGDKSEQKDKKPEKG